MRRDPYQEALELLRAIGVNLWWVLMALLVLGLIAAQALVDVVVTIAAVVLAIPVWLVLWLKWWRRSCASS